MLRNKLRNRNLRGLSLLTVFALSVSACKQVTPTIVSPNTTGGGKTAFSASPVTPATAQPTAPTPEFSYVNCKTTTTCQPARQDVIGLTANNQLAGTVGQPVVWVFHGRDLNTLNSTQIVPNIQGSDRRVTVIATNLPSGATLVPTPNVAELFTQENIVWTPSVSGTGVLQILLRDYDRCLVVEATPATICNALTSTIYDFSVNVPWQVVEAPPARVPSAREPATIPQAIGQFAGGFVGGVVGSLIQRLIGGPTNSEPNGGVTTFTYSNQAQVYPDCKANGGWGYGCNWKCGTLWCSKDDQGFADSSICTVTKAGGPSC